MPKDTTKYIFNDQEYGKGRLVLAIIQHYVKSYSPTFAELGAEFPQNIQGSRGLLISEQDYDKKYEISADIKKRYFIEPFESLKTSDGINVFVSTQWGVGNIKNMLNKAKELNYKVDILKGDIKSIDELYEEYKSSPWSEWIESYENTCDRLATYKGKPASEYDEALLIDIWRSTDNGIAGVSPGFLSHDEFNLLKSDLPEITSKIVNSPSSDVLKETYAWARKAKTQDRFKAIKWGVINRVFCAANPQEYSTVINETDLKNLVKKLNNLFDLNIALSSNWAIQNKNLMDAIKSLGLEDENIYLINTFVWKLLERFVKTGKKNESVEERKTKPNKNSPSNLTQNMIIYGPPGTGKTYTLQKLIDDEYTDKGVIQDRDLWLAEHIDKLNWVEVLLLVLLDSSQALKVADIVPHEYYQIKARLNNRTANLSQTAWSALQSHTVAHSKTVKYEKRIEPLVFDKNEKSLWFIDEPENEQLEEYKGLLASFREGPKQAETIKRYDFVTFHQSYGYEEFIEGLRPVTNDNGDISYEVKPGIFKRLCQKAESDSDNQYALVIDEINRGNISKIFGELISLIETDKRQGCDYELTVTLPYSGQSFSVPSNVNIIGTMNTADRSLTHIDVALRRRFEFKELRTDYSLLSSDIEGVNLKHMLYTINQRIELLLDREHILGHALLMNVTSLAELANAFQTNIIPLLEEYFFENWDKINQVLGHNGFIIEHKEAHNIWLGEGDEYSPKAFTIDESAFNQTDSYQKIYANIDKSAFIECDKVQAK